MKSFFALAMLAVAVVAAVVAATEALERQEFVDWMHAHGKSYAAGEFRQRYGVWLENRRFVNEFSGTHRVALNKFSDLTAEEFGRIYLGVKGAAEAQVSAQEGAAVATDSLPTEVDWRKHGAVTAVKNQGQCGSCWSFSTTGSTEGAHAISSGSLVSLSEQNLMDCSTSYGNNGCNGGLMDNAFRYIIANNGLDTEQCYPYTAADGTCHFKSSCVGATLSNFKDIPQGNEEALQAAVASVGPISVAIDAGLSSFQMYSGGVYSDPSCGNQPNNLDHGVLVVGYGQDSGTDMWIVKNSWGADWGLSGYIYMARNDDNMCGVATMASYPIV